MIADMATLKETADKLSQSLDQGANEELLKAARQISEMSTAWEVFKKNLAARIAPIIIPVLYSFTISLKLANVTGATHIGAQCTYDPYYISAAPVTQDLGTGSGGLVTTQLNMNRNIGPIYCRFPYLDNSNNVLSRGDIAQF